MTLNKNHENLRRSVSHKLKVLVSAYACEPHKGSEPGVGWNWAKQIAKFAEVWVITRKNNREVIEEEMKKNPEPNLHFVYVDLPKWMRFWKKRQRGVHLYYFLWQFAAYFKARRLNKNIKFDIAHHITFVNDWMPSYLAFIDVPFIWGPIGCNKPIPLKYLPSIKEYLIDRVKHFLRLILRIINPFYFVTLLKSKKIILISKEQQKTFPFRFLSSNKIFFQSANAIEINECNFDIATKGLRNNFTIFSAGTLIPIKGFHLSLQAVAELINKKKEIKFVIAGDGSLKHYLKSLAKTLKIEEKVSFLGNLKRTNVLKLMNNSNIFLFPSFEGGGMVVLEAMACGLPVVCLDYGGPGEMVTNECGIKVKPITPEQTINDLADALLKLANDPALRIKMGEAGRKRVQEYYTWEKKGEFIKKVYEEVLNKKLSGYS
jgi:glycosyltransferase involved in cell wall biosynthesis